MSEPMTRDELSKVYRDLYFGNECAHCCVRLRRLAQTLINEALVLHDEVSGLRSRTRREQENLSQAALVNP